MTDGGDFANSTLYVIYNGASAYTGDLPANETQFTLPPAPSGKNWYRVTDTCEWNDGPEHLGRAGKRNPDRTRKFDLWRVRPGFGAVHRQVAFVAETVVRAQEPITRGIASFAVAGKGDRGAEKIASRAKPHEGGRTALFACQLPATPSSQAMRSRVTSSRLVSFSVSCRAPG